MEAEKKEEEEEEAEGRKEQAMEGLFPAVLAGHLPYFSSVE